MRNLVVVQQDEQCVAGGEESGREGADAVTALAVDTGTGQSYMLRGSGELRRLEEYGAMAESGEGVAGPEWKARLPRVADAWSFAHYQPDAHAVVCAARSGEVVAVGVESGDGTALGVFEAVCGLREGVCGGLRGCTGGRSAARRGSATCRGRRTASWCWW
jgi:hypothetical protein